jgi:hypothetical protein
VKEAGYRSARSTYADHRHSLADLFTLTGFFDTTNVARIEYGLRTAELVERAEEPFPGIEPAEFLKTGTGYYDRILPRSPPCRRTTRDSSAPVARGERSA